MDFNVDLYKLSSHQKETALSPQLNAMTDKKKSTGWLVIQHSDGNEIVGASGTKRLCQGVK